VTFAIGNASVPATATPTATVGQGARDPNAIATEQHVNDTVARERLARGLYNTLNDVSEEGDLVRRDALLDELRELAKRHADDAAVRERLIRGLSNTRNYAIGEGDLARCDVPLSELWGLASVYPSDRTIQATLRPWLDAIARR
jgi:hypothetical protein